MVETPTTKKTKILWSAVGLIGVITTNVIRLLIVTASIGFYGYTIGQQIHQVIGYILFLSWLGIFLMLFAQRRIIINKFQIMQKRILSWL